MLITQLLVVFCHYSVWLCRLCGSHVVPALATLFLMSYTKILLTVTNALSMSQLPCNDSVLTVWSVDGNIEYGSGKHLILVVFSCGILHGCWISLFCFSVVCSSARKIQSQVYSIAQVESCSKVQASFGCIWRTLQRQLSILDRSDSDGVTDCHCDILVHFGRIGYHQCFHHQYHCSGDIDILVFHKRCV